MRYHYSISKKVVRRNFLSINLSKAKYITCIKTFFCQSPCSNLIEDRYSRSAKWKIDVCMHGKRGKTQKKSIKTAKYKFLNIACIEDFKNRVATALFSPHPLLRFTVWRREDGATLHFRLPPPLSYPPLGAAPVRPGRLPNQ